MKIEQISQTSWVERLAHCNCKILSYLVQCAGFVGFAIEIAI